MEGKEENAQIYNKERWKDNGLWFLCLMSYQPSWVIKCQSGLCRRIAVVLFKL